LQRHRLVLEYDGWEFRGWQRQADGRSVQASLEDALRQVVGAEVRVHGAGRTDAGVHALGQVAHVDLATRLAPPELRAALNSVLPPDLGLRELTRAAADFDARRDAIAKRYVYRVLNRPEPAPLRRRVTWHLRRPLDLPAMSAAAAAALGSHDFAAFRGAPGGADPGEDTRRSLERLDVERREDELLFVAEGRSFLRYMVRNLVGTLVEVGRGSRPPADMARLLATGDRSQAGPTAPAHGLCLHEVRYPSSVCSSG
jgi:tRNA pseudouridine38-40 synthase